MKLHDKKFGLMTNHEKLIKNHHSSKLKNLSLNNNNNVFPLKSEFRQYTNKPIPEDKPEATIKSVFMSAIVICFWCFAMCLLAKVSYQFLQDICVNSVQEFNLNQK